jgi:hypothetical protein
MKRAPYRPWYSDDRVAWAVYAFGLTAMFGVLWTSVVFEGSRDIRVQLNGGGFWGSCSSPPVHSLSPAQWPWPSFN